MPSLSPNLILFLLLILWKVYNNLARLAIVLSLPLQEIQY